MHSPILTLLNLMKTEFEGGKKNSSQFFKCKTSCGKMMKGYIEWYGKKKKKKQWRFENHKKILHQLRIIIK